MHSESLIKAEKQLINFLKLEVLRHLMADYGWQYARIPSNVMKR